VQSPGLALRPEACGRLPRITMSAAQVLAGISPALVKRALMFTLILGRTQGAEIRKLALSLGERAKTQSPPFLVGEAAEVRGGTAVSSGRCGTRSERARGLRFLWSNTGYIAALPG
jgi:hypothetical protein